MSTSNKTLVIGGAGFIGKRFLAAYRQSFPDAIGTARLHTDAHLCYDLKDPFPEIDLSGYTHAMIAAAVCRMSLCEQDKEATFQCNVERALYLAQYFAKRGITPILFSTDYIYDGIAGDYTEASRPNPLNEYGRQKVVLEERLPSVCGDDFLLIRPGKVFGLEKGDKTLFDEMASCLTKQIPIRAAYDQIFSPIVIQDLIEAVFSLQRLGLKGTFNICGQEKWSRYDLGLKIAEKLSVPFHLVEPISLDDLNETFKRPKCTTMRLDKLLQNIEIKMAPMEACIEKITSSYEPICHHS